MNPAELASGQGAQPPLPLRELRFPEQLALAGSIRLGSIEQVRQLATDCPCDVVAAQRLALHYQLATTADGSPVAVVARRTNAGELPERVLLVPDGALPLAADWAVNHGRWSWLRPAPIRSSKDTADAATERCHLVLNSWRDAFELREASLGADHQTTQGLRPPQVGAFYAALAHWRVTFDPATIVLPTGTGKTETMLALLAHERFPCLLVVVPNAPLRDQIANKFRTFGLLPQLGMLGSEIRFPVVGTLRHNPRTPDEVSDFFRRCNVVVTTMSVCGQASEAVQHAMAAAASHLFIDEAHHVAARTWSKFRAVFAGKPVLQFTATPFRSDGRPVDGKIIFNYPLRRAQAEDYFRPITLVPVTEYLDDAADHAIAQAAVTLLDRDLDEGKDHILMARTDTIERAKKVFDVYGEVAPHHAPILIHSQTNPAERKRAQDQLNTRGSRVLVCVNMFGEGFDLPELKIAAMHDVHKSLAITLQFTGRFTRSKPNLGDASIVANVADPQVEDSLQALYAEDADWNHLFRYLSEGAVGRQAAKSEFIDAFGDQRSDIPLQNIFPKMSTVVFATRCQRWKPEQLIDALPQERFYVAPIINSRHRVAVFVTREIEPVPWGVVRTVQNTFYDLYLLHWNEAQNLLFVHSSNNKSLHEDFATVVCGDGARRIHGESVFRVFGRAERLMLMNLGLGHTLGRSVRFTMYVGADVVAGLAEAHLGNKYKSNLFGRGYEHGDRVTIGCSQKGRIWSYRVADDISQWMEWCHDIGDKLLDESITPQRALRGVLIPRQLTARPERVPLAVEWPFELLARPEDMVAFEVGGTTALLLETGLELVNRDTTGDLTFAVVCDQWRAKYRVEFRDNRVDYVPTGTQNVTVVLGQKRTSLTDFFQLHHPEFTFERNAQLVYNLFFEPLDAPGSRFRLDDIKVADWTGVNIRSESQTPAKTADSIQRKMLNTLLDPAHPIQYDIVMDDDDKHEAADIVALKIDGDRLLVHLTHCKFSSADQPGHRLKDMEVVCGQAQRSVQWHSGVDRLFAHLKNREQARVQKGLASRFERGDMRALNKMKRAARLLTPAFAFTIVQPGLSKAGVTDGLLELLGSTELYLKETCRGPLTVIASA